MGAAIDPSCQRFQDGAYFSLQGYGLTECAPIVALTECGFQGRSRFAMPGVDIVIDNPDENGIGNYCKLQMSCSDITRMKLLLQVIDSKDISTQVTLAIWIKKSLFILLEEEECNCYKEW